MLLPHNTYWSNIQYRKCATISMWETSNDWAV
jgi:hypothetical protein